MKRNTTKARAFDIVCLLSPTFGLGLRARAQAHYSLENSTETAAEKQTVEDKQVRKLEPHRREKKNRRHQEDETTAGLRRIFNYHSLVFV